MKFSTETMREVWCDDQDYEHFEIGPDRDGLGCVEVRMKDKEGKILERFAVAPEMAELIGQAMILCAKELKQ